MNVFISYPREFKTAAMALQAELASRNINRFLDTEDIEIGDVWRMTIEANIARADVFVILYLPEADTNGRVFQIEVEHIRNACISNPKKRLITVIFPPATTGEIPSYFRTRQSLIADVKGDSKDDAEHGYWIDQIVRKIKRVEAEDNLRRRRIIARTALATGAIVISALSFHLNQIKNDLDDKKREINLLKTSQQQPMQAVGSVGGLGNGQVRCQRLIGNYGLHQNYVFASGVDSRSIATRANWKATSCDFDDMSDLFILRGEEVTDFDIEAIISNRYERIARATYKYTSSVTISRDGKLVGRSFETVKNPQILETIYVDRNGNSLVGFKDFIDSKIKNAIELRAIRHEDLRTKNCTPAIGEMGGRTMISFVCNDYTRVMVKIADPLNKI
jgi:hypothetical protein